MIQPAELSEGERRRFLDRAARALHARRSPIERSAVGALTELVRRLRDQRSGSRAARSVAPRGDTDDPVPLVAAKGTRDDIPQSRPAASRRLERRTHVDAAACRRRLPRAETFRGRRARHATSSRSDRAPTVEMRPSCAERLRRPRREIRTSTDSLPPCAADAAREVAARNASGSAPYLPHAERPGIDLRALPAQRALGPDPDRRAVARRAPR